MAQMAVVILSSGSLFVEGVAASLRRHLGDASVLTLDIQQPGVMEQVLDARPAAVVMDGADAEAVRNCPPDQVLDRLPTARVITLDPRLNQLQVLSVEQRQVVGMGDLLNVIESLRQAPSETGDIEGQRRWPVQPARNRLNQPETANSNKENEV